MRRFLAIVEAALLCVGVLFGFAALAGLPFLTVLGVFSLAVAIVALFIGGVWLALWLWNVR